MRGLTAADGTLEVQQLSADQEDDQADRRDAQIKQQLQQIAVEAGQRCAWYERKEHRSKLHQGIVSIHQRHQYRAHIFRFHRLHPEGKAQRRRNDDDAADQVETVPVVEERDEAHDDHRQHAAENQRIDRQRQEDDEETQKRQE